MSLEEIATEKIDKLKAQYGKELVAIEALNSWLVFRKATRHEYDRYVDRITADRSNTREAAWELAQATIVDPGPAALKDAMELEPAILLGDILPAMNGLVGDDRAKRKVKL